MPILVIIESLFACSVSKRWLLSTDVKMGGTATGSIESVSLSGNGPSMLIP